MKKKLKFSLSQFYGVSVMFPTVLLDAGVGGAYSLDSESTALGWCRVSRWWCGNTWWNMDPCSKSLLVHSEIFIVEETSCRVTGSHRPARSTRTLKSHSVCLRQCRVFTTDSASDFIYWRFKPKIPTQRSRPCTMCSHILTPRHPKKYHHSSVLYKNLWIWCINDWYL